MEFGLSGEAFHNLFVASGVAGIGVMSLIMLIAKRRGVNISSHRFIVTLGMIILLIFVGIPFSLTPEFSPLQKVGLIGFMLAVGIFHYFAMDRMQHNFAEWRRERKEKRQGRG